MVQKMRLAEEGERLTAEEKGQIEALVQQLHDVCSAFRDLQQLQDRLKMTDDEYRMNLDKLEESYKRSVKEIFGQRDGVIQMIPKFWVKSILGHTGLGQELTEMDRKILKHLESLRVDSPKDHGYVITLVLNAIAIELWKSPLEYHQAIDLEYYKP